MSKFYQVLACSKPETSAPSDRHKEGQLYVVADLIEIRPELKEFKNLITGRKPFRLAFFADQGAFYEMVQKPDAVVLGHIANRQIAPSYVINPETNKPYEYGKNHELAGKDVVTTQIKFFVSDGEDEDALFRSVCQRNRGNLVPTGELKVYASYLGIEEPDDVAATKEEEEDLVAGEETAEETPAEPETK